MRNVHIGPFPPPLGGLSVGIYRLSKIRKNDMFINEREFGNSLNFRLWYIKQIFNLKKKNFIYHTHNMRRRLLFFLLSCISIHKFSLVIRGRLLILDYNNSNRIKKKLIRMMLAKAYFIQVVNPEYKEFIYNLGVKNQNIFVKYGYIPPPIEDEPKIIKTYEKNLLEFINKKSPLIISNASMIQFYNNQDLYGIDICIELTKLLKTDHPNVGFLFALANSARNAQYFNKMKEKIIQLDLKNHFYFMTGQKELWPIFKKADLVIRATNVDGDAISIREALFFNVPVIASDVTIRPKECVLFQNRNVFDLYEKCKEILSKHNRL